MNMEAQIYFLILLFLTPLFTFLLHVAMIRFFQCFDTRLSPLVICGLSIVIGYFLVAIGAWQVYLKSVETSAEFLSGVIYGALVYGSLSFSYFILFAMTESARRIRILCELYRKGEVQLKQLAQDYGMDAMLSVRLERMAELGQLKCVGGRYLLKGRLLYRVGRVMMFWSRLLGFSK